MRLAIVNITSGGLSGGYRKYLQNIAPLLANDSRIKELNIFIPSSNNDLLFNNMATVHYIPSSNILRKIFWLKKEIAAWKPDVVFVPTARVLSFGDVPVITMVRNMEPLVMPFLGNPLRERIKNVGRIAAAKYACKRAERVIAVSNFVKKYMLERWKISEQRIGVVYHGVDPNSYLSNNSGSAVVSIKSSRFLFTAGSIRPARGLEDIIEALAILNAEQPVQLVVGGNVDPGMEPYFARLKRIATKLGITESIKWLGKLNDAEMAWCYSHCEAFVMSSRVEACPNIALEAMSQGCISIVSENPPLPEFFGDSALYYPPRDIIALANRIQTVVSMKKPEREALSEAAKSIATRFSWEICAKKTVTELQKALM
jgi:glycosyltransferase involved in cell wall biosynthesis